MFSCCSNSQSSSLKQVGETWKSGCKSCVCDKDTMSVECDPIICPIPEPIVCTAEGEVLMNSTLDCCSKQSCGEWCPSSLWDDILSCAKPSLSFLVFYAFQYATRPAARCHQIAAWGSSWPGTPQKPAAARCITVVKIWHTHLNTKPAAFLTISEINRYSILFCHIVPKKVCVFNNTEYTVGIYNLIKFIRIYYCLWYRCWNSATNSTVLLLQPGVEFTKNPCEHCQCTYHQDPITKLNAMQCYTLACDINCPEVRFLFILPEHCCSTCRMWSSVLFLGLHV